MDLIELKDKDGNNKQYELCIIYKTNKKHYIVYKKIEEEKYYASYYMIENGNINPKLYTDLSKSEYDKLEKIFKKGTLEYV